MKMRDLIDRQKLQAILRDNPKDKDGFYMLTNSWDGSDWIGWYEEKIAEAPAVDAVEVVRCKDCHYAGESVHPHCVYCGEHQRAVNEDGFCSYGESDKR